MSNGERICAIIGGSVLPNDFTEDQEERCKAFGAWLAHNGFTVRTGACDGFPYLVGKGAVDAGGTVVGYSPATNAADHESVFNKPFDGVTDIVYLTVPIDDPMERLLVRSVPLLRDADVVVSLEGCWGTLFELIIGVVTGAPIITVSEFDGASKSFERVYDDMASGCRFDYGERYTSVATVEDARAELERIL